MVFNIGRDRTVNYRVLMGWRLEPHVIDSQNKDVPSAKVTATNQYVPTISTPTNEHGWVTLVLAEKMINLTGQYPVGTYTVKAQYETNTGSITMTMVSDKKITIQLAFIVPEFPNLMILPVLLAMTLAIILSERKEGA